MTYYVYDAQSFVASFNAAPESNEYHDEIRRISGQVGDNRQIDIYTLKKGELQWESSTLICRCR